MVLNKKKGWQTNLNKVTFSLRSACKSWMLLLSCLPAKPSIKGYDHLMQLLLNSTDWYGYVPKHWPSKSCLEQKKTNEFADPISCRAFNEKVSHKQLVSIWKSEYTQIWDALNLTFRFFLNHIKLPDLPLPTLCRQRQLEGHVFELRAAHEVRGEVRQLLKANLHLDKMEDSFTLQTTNGPMEVS